MLRSRAGPETRTGAATSRRSRDGWSSGASGGCRRSPSLNRPGLAHRPSAAERRRPSGCVAGRLQQGAMRTVPEPEGPSRLVNQFAKLLHGLCAVRGESEPGPVERAVIAKVARDTIPKSACRLRSPHADGPAFLPERPRVGAEERQGSRGGLLSPGARDAASLRESGSPRHDVTGAPAPERIFSDAEGRPWRNGAFRRQVGPPCSGAQASLRKASCPPTYRGEPLVAAGEPCPMWRGSSDT